MNFLLVAAFITFAIGFVHSDEKKEFKELAKIKTNELKQLINKLNESISKLDHKIDSVVREMVTYNIPYDEQKFVELTQRLSSEIRAAKNRLAKSTVGVDDLLRDIEETGRFDEARYEEIIKASNAVISVAENAYNELQNFVDTARAQNNGYS